MSACLPNWLQSLLRTSPPFLKGGGRRRSSGDYFSLEFSCCKLTESPFDSPFDKGGRGKSKQLPGKQTGIHKLEIGSKCVNDVNLS